MAKRGTKTRSATSSPPSTSTDGIAPMAKSMKSRNSGKMKGKTIAQRREAKIDAMKPKKPPTAFFYFLEDFRKGYQEQNPDVKSMRDIGKACGEKWKTMKFEEKVQYYDIATEKRAEFDMATSDFNKRKECGEFDDVDSDDSEFDG